MNPRHFVFLTSTDIDGKLHTMYLVKTESGSFWTEDRSKMMLMSEDEASDLAVNGAGCGSLNSGVYTPADNNVAVQSLDLIDDGKDYVVFTTGDRKIADILDKVCDEANVTDIADEFHYQGWIEVKK